MRHFKVLDEIKVLPLNQDGAEEGLGFQETPTSPPWLWQCSWQSPGSFGAKASGFLENTDSLQL